MVHQIKKVKILVDNIDSVAEICDMYNLSREDVEVRLIPKKYCTGDLSPVRESIFARAKRSAICALGLGDL